jgi:hypothetical protein
MRFNGKKRVWRRPGERLNPAVTVGTVKHDKKIMVWGAFCAHGVGILHRIEGIMMKEHYNFILQNVMLPSADMLFGRENWIFQQDNDPKHTAIIDKELIREEGITTFQWPSQSPDLNPIENLWSILDYQCKSRRPSNEAQLFTTLQNAWRALPRDLLEHLVASMPNRCKAVIESDGMPTKY